MRRMRPPLLLWAAALCLSWPVAFVSSDGRNGQHCDFENSTNPGCGWKWERTGHGFQVVTGQEVASLHDNMRGVSGPEVDANNNAQGHFLFLNMQPNSSEPLYVRSPLYSFYNRLCTLQLMMHTSNESSGNSISVFAETQQNNGSVRWNLAQNISNSVGGWENHTIQIGRVFQNITIFIEVNSTKRSGHVAIDNLELSNCFGMTRLIKPEHCNGTYHFHCATGECLAHSHVCDLVRDCPQGEDEGEDQDCYKVPPGARCDFQDGMCGWNATSSGEGDGPLWTRINGTLPKNKVVMDHTYGNESGVYLYVQSPGRRAFGKETYLDSVIFHPPPPYHSDIKSPYYNSCEIRFFKHQSGSHVGSLGVIVYEYFPRNKIKRHDVFYIYGENKASWTQVLITLPALKYRYRIQIEARSGMGTADLAVDDITLSPECFGLKVNASEVEGYDYEKAGEIIEPVEPAIHKDFVNQTFYHFTTCGAKGMVGPVQEGCNKEYNGTSVNVTVLTEAPFAGVQRWTVPESGFYTLIARGASGGMGSDGNGWSQAAEVRLVAKLEAGQALHFLVGQEGMSTCRKKSRGGESRNECRSTFNAPIDKTASVKQLKFQKMPSGGGGGGGTFVFKRLKSRINAEALLVAAGGGGLGNEGKGPGQHVFDDEWHHGHGINESRNGLGGKGLGKEPAGPGGGWFPVNVSEQAGLSLLQGGHGGRGCKNSSDGGFGGGGGGCSTGGGGGGYAGGNSWSERHNHGEGGYSYVVDGGLLRSVVPAAHEGPGEVFVIPSVSGCGCEHRCVALNVQRSRTECVCPDGARVVEKSCADGSYNKPYLYAIPVVLVGLMLLALSFFCIVVYNLYCKRKEMDPRRKVLSSADLQLRTLRNDLMTETNPNYEFAGGVCTVKDLKDVPRERLRLVRALGQGAFGEVYQGFYRARPNDAVEMPVAVKTLPELSTSQAESDFLMEALIMSKFNHPNIVHLIGVCFDRHPRYIVLELLDGGDLKTFLRESRPRPGRPSPLNMRDLLTCCHDVAKGCKYLEDHRFIHRDIAARNCLLTSKGPGRTVKIADFGMAREVYMADYYRKGGKAMLPIKWMPPEAFLDGIFTTKTDVWAFGVLLWEVMSLGYMPYTGCANRDVMNLVVSGARLEPPPNCPPPVYAIMTSCWNPDPQVRPTFSTVMERLGYCLQDPDVLNTPLPTCLPPTSTEDVTVMRPPDCEDACPLPCSSNGEMITDRSPVADYLVPVDKLHTQTQPHRPPPAPAPCEGWMPGHTPTRSRSKQPLLQGDSSSSSVGSLLSLDKSLPNNNNNTATNHHTRNGPISNTPHGGKANMDHMRHALPLDPSLLGKTYMHNKLSQDAETGFGGATNHIMPDSEISC